MITYIYLFDLLGVTSFALFGAYVGLKKHFDLFGIFVCAMVSSLGGGTIREIILGKIPVYLTDYNYLYATIAGMAAALILYKHFHKIQKYFFYVDAVGLSTFAFIGAERANYFHLSTIAIIFFATITAVGGSILRDVAIREVPYIFHRDFYASPAIILGFIFAIFRNRMENSTAAFLLISGIFILRSIAIKYNLNLWSIKD